MTHISYPNILVTSENGQFRIDITGRPTKKSFRDQSDFVYRLYRSDRLMWTWTAHNEQDDITFLDDFPHDAWVSDSGWVVVRTHEWFRAGIMVFAPTGEVVLRRLHRRVLDEESPGFLDDEPEEYMGATSAGPFWARSSFAHFFEQDGRPFWAIRTWWGRRVVIDLIQAMFVEPAEIKQQHVRDLEIAHIRSVLSEAIDELEACDKEPRCDTGNDGEFWSLASSVLTAAYHAGWLQAVDCIPYLRRLESAGAVGSCGFHAVAWATLLTLPFRCVAKASLLRLGNEPRWLPHYQFKLDEDMVDGCLKEEGTLFPFPEQVKLRVPDLLEVGMDQKETLQRIGAPDFIRDEWEYDFFSAESAFTVRVFWDESHLKNLPYRKYKELAYECPPRIAKVLIVEPQWKTITMRDHYMTH